MPQVNIDELKKHPACIKLYGERVALHKEAGELVSLCPFHAEKSGSLHIYQDRDGTWVYKCFGCGVAGNIAQFIKEFDKVSMKEALDRVNKAISGNWEDIRSNVESTFRSATADTKEYKTFSLDQFRAQIEALERSPEAQRWLKEVRGIEMSTARDLRLGFKQDIGRLAGEKNAAIAAAGWVSFPCIEGDKVVSIKYRSITTKAFSRQPGMATALFNLPAIDMFDPVYVVEGELDAAALAQAGFRAVSIPSASSSLTPDMKSALKTADCIVLAGDCDGGVGSQAMEKLWRDLRDRTYLLKWPDGKKDANQVYLETCGRDVSVFADLVHDLTLQAKSQPIPDVYSLPDVMLASNQTSLKDHPLRLHFPWPSVDRMAILLPGSVVSVIATQTGMGKTAWTNEVCLFNAREYDEVILNYQCELNTDEMATMAAANVLRHDRNHLEKEHLAQAARIIRDAKYYIGNNPALDRVDPVLDLIEDAIRVLGATIVVLDHLHFICRNEKDEIQSQANAMARIKRMSQKYGVKFIVVGQPRKANQQNKGKRIHITDGKGSETFGSDADAFFILHRDLITNIDPANPPSDPYDPKTEVHLAKARAKGDGAALAMLMFIGKYAAFQEIEYRYNEGEQ